MAFGGSDILKLIVDADTSGAVSEFKKLGSTIETSGDKAATGFKGSLTKAFDGLQSKSATVSGIFDKVGVSSQQAAGVITAAIPAAGVAAAGALVAFAAKGVQAFQETALAAGKFADSTGLSVDAASRYIAVADDIGVGASTIQSAFVKMEKAMATNKAAFGDLVATTKSGGVDLDKTFLNAITHLQGIKDPIERANESSKLFGKGFAEVSQIIGTNADTLKKELASVSDAQVINDAELKKARDFQAAMDNLSDSVRDLSIQLGSALVPALSSSANALTSFITQTQQINKKSGGLFGDLVKSAIDVANPIGAVKDNWNKLQDAFGSSKTGEAAGSFNVLGVALNAVTTAANSATAAGPGFAGALSAVQVAAAGVADAATKANKSLTDLANAQIAAFDSTFAVKDAQDQFAKSLMAAESAAASGTASAGELQNAYDAETQAAEKVAVATVDKAQKDAIASGKALTAKQSNDLLIATLQAQAAQASGPTAAALNGLIKDLQNVGAQHPQPTVTVNTGDAMFKLADTQRAVDRLDGARASVSVSANTSAANAALDRLNQRIQNAAAATGTRAPAFARGTGSAPGGFALVGEQGPELIYLPKGSAVKTAGETKSIMAGPTALPISGAGGSGTVVQITVNGAVDPYSTARQIQTILAKGARGGFATKAA